VLDGRVSLEAARQEYGVDVDVRKQEINIAATRELRSHSPSG